MQRVRRKRIHLAELVSYKVPGPHFARRLLPTLRLPTLRQCPCRRFLLTGPRSVRIPIRRRQDLTESAGNAFSVVHGALQEQPLGSHEQRALLPDTGSRPRQRRQGAAPPRGAARPVLARIAQAGHVRTAVDCRARWPATLGHGAMTRRRSCPSLPAAGSWQLMSLGSTDRS